MAGNKEDFTKYFIIGGNGVIDGISDDAPPEAKQECERLLKKQKSFRQNNR